MDLPPQKRVYARKRILVIDDDIGVTTLVKRYLEEYGQFEVLVLNTSRESLSVARNFNPDLILLDLMMPVKTGDEVADDMKGDPQLKDTPIIFLTGVILEQEAKSRDGRIGGHVFMSKPVNLQDLMQCIHKNIR